MTKKLFARCLLILAGFLAPVTGFAAAETLSPDELVRNVASEVLSIVRNDKAIQGGDTRKALALVEEKVLPHFDFRRMTSLAVGQGWRSASPEQQERLITAFRTLLVRTYSNALTQFRNQTVEFKPLRANPGEKRVKVSTEVRQPGAQSIPIDYSLEQTEQGWKVFDVVVAGVSLVINYRDEFGNEIRAKGVDGLIASLEGKNKSLEAKQGDKE